MCFFIKTLILTKKFKKNTYNITEVLKLRSGVLKLLKIILIMISKKTKEILFWLVMLAAFVSFICSFPSCSSIKQQQQAKYITQNSVSEESIEVNGKEDITVYDSVKDTSVIVTLTPIIDVPFSSVKDIYGGLNSDGYKVKEVKIEAKTTTNQTQTTANQTQKIQTKKSADLTSTESTTTKTTKQNNRNILPWFLFVGLFCLFAFVVLKKNRTEIYLHDGTRMLDNKNIFSHYFYNNHIIVYHDNMLNLYDNLSQPPLETKEPSEGSTTFNIGGEEVKFMMEGYTIKLVEER